MECECYRELYERFTSLPLSSEVWNSEEFNSWHTHGLECKSCSHWDLLNQVRSRGIDVATYPCVHVAYHSTHTCSMHSDPWECPDMILVRTHKGFGIPIRDGGSSFIQIEFCPWCGIDLSPD